MHKGERGIKKEWKLIWRGIKVIHQLQPFIILVSIAAGLFTAIYPFIALYFSSKIINELMVSRDWNKIGQYVILTVILNLLCQLINSFLNQMLDVLQYVLGHKKELQVADKGYQLDYADMEDNSIREKREKLNRGRYSKGIMAIAPQVRDMVRCGCSFVVSISLVVSMFLAKSSGTSRMDQFLNSPFTAILLVFMLFASILYMARTNSIIQKKEYETQDELRSDFNYMGFYGFELSRNYNFGKDIRLYHEQPLIKKELTGHFNRILHFEKVITKMSSIYHSASGAMVILINILTYLYVGLKSLMGAFEVGNIMLYTGAVTQFGNSLSDVVQILISIQRESQYLEWYFEFMDIPNRKETGTKKIKEEEVKNYEIEFRNVTFRYPASNRDSLKNINIRFRAGERVAVVGKNGSGKTTFIKLLCRLYDPQEGEILLNGINIKEYNYYDYLSIFSVVFQDFNLFSFTLGENVAAASNYEEEKVLECVNKAGLEERMDHFPNGVKTQLYNEFAEEGVEISGGEAQKIAIARALYKNGPFIVLDEPTAALDPIAEADIYARLNDLIQNKTAIYISHRLSSCYFCNQIAVFEDGEIVQYGTHKELMEQTEGIYHELWTSQAQYYI